MGGELCISSHSNGKQRCSGWIQQDKVIYKSFINNSKIYHSCIGISDIIIEITSMNGQIKKKAKICWPSRETTFDCKSCIEKQY